MTRLFPSLLAANSLNLQEDITTTLSQGADGLHLDIMDGHFVPNLSFGPHIVEAISTFTRCYTDTHLMVTKPQKFLDAFLKAGTHALSFHIEAVDDPLPLLEVIHKYGCAAGLAINPQTPLKAIEPYLERCDFILFMTVNPGFGGQEFIPEPLKKIKELNHIKQQRNLSLDIRVDGGITRHNAKSIVTAGANTLIMGSGLLKQPNPQEIIDYIHQLN